MTTELYLARRLVEGRAHERQDRALARAAEQALKAGRRRRRDRARR